MSSGFRSRFRLRINCTAWTSALRLGATRSMMSWRTARRSALWSCSWWKASSWAATTSPCAARMSRIFSRVSSPRMRKLMASAISTVTVEATNRTVRIFRRRGQSRKRNARRIVNPLSSDQWAGWRGLSIERDRRESIQGHFPLVPLRRQAENARELPRGTLDADFWERDNRPAYSVYRSGGRPMHIICPQCHSPVETVGLSAREEVHCPSCGSGFHLEYGSTSAGDPNTGRRLGRFELLAVVGHGA